MEIASQDQSDSAKIARLEATVADLASRVGPDVLGGPVPVMPDASAERASKEKRDALEGMLAERGELLKRIDEAIGELSEFVLAERSLRADIRTIGLPKEFREPMSDEIVLAVILAKLAERGVGRDRRLDRSAARPPLAALADLHPLIIRAVKG